MAETEERSVDANKQDRSEYYPEWEGDEEQRKDRKSTAKLFGPQKDPQWWDISTFSKDDNPHGLVTESSFSSLFPKYREKYIRECWPLMEKAMADHFLKADLDVIEGTMTVRTTRKTWDPYILVKARDVLKLLSRGVTFEQSIRVLDDEIFCEIIKIDTLCRNKERFLKRRNRLVGNNGSTLKAMELLTKCYVCIQGGTVCAVGPLTGLKQVNKIVTDCMSNVHPIYNIKTLMIKRELEKNEDLKNENWERFLPKFKKRVQTAAATKEAKKKKAKSWKEKKPYTPFPNPPQMSKLDLQLESGEYFFDEEVNKRVKMKEKRMKSHENAEINKKEKLKVYQPKEEKPREKKTKRKEAEPVDLEALKQKAKKLKKSA
ncbi:unnamed protein product [Auanema sp. JU1783]|nr:unnamed protein product [Auanema sp. JU1783]